MERSLQGLPPITRSNGPHSSIWQRNHNASSLHSRKKRLKASSTDYYYAFEQIRLSLTCLRVTVRTSPTYMMRPSWRTMPTVMESSHTSDATYLSTWIPKSFSTNSPDFTHTHLFFCQRNQGNQRSFYRKHAAVQVGVGEFHVLHFAGPFPLIMKHVTGSVLAQH